MTQRTQAATSKGPTDWFTGDVWIDALSTGQSAPMSISSGAFSPGARTAWHHHAGGQTLWVLEGAGRVQARGEPVLAIGAGDVITARPGEEHGTVQLPDRFMTHLSIAEGEPTWGDHVTDDDYSAPARIAERPCRPMDFLMSW